jgi:hypothetical protein
MDAENPVLRVAVSSDRRRVVSESDGVECVTKRSSVKNK